jgi:chromosome segregation ATPase
LALADAEVKRAKAGEKELADELEKRRSKEKEDAIRMQVLVRENSTLVMEHERIESEMELMGGDLAKAQDRIETLEEELEQCVRENQEKLRALNEKLLGQLKASEALSAERLSQVNELKKTLDETLGDMKSAKERLLMLEEELKRVKVGAHDLHQDMALKISEVHSLKMKVKWAFMITTFTIQVRIFRKATVR